MERLLDILLKYSKAGYKELQSTQIDMTRLAREVYEDLRNVHPGKNIQCHISSLPFAYGDTVLIHQVLMNLLSNSIKYSRNREITEIEIGGQVDGNKNIYYVKDNGVGFDMHQVNKIFEVFQRLHNDEEYEGTGVGLSIVQRIIQRHGGEVWAEGKINQGATFYFTLGNTNGHKDKG
jgi:light-regulated signal transduction histidine kinase (bacteriophytochrome)